MKWVDEIVFTLDGEIAGELEEDVLSWRTRFYQPAFSCICRVVVSSVIEIWRCNCSSIIYSDI